MAAGEVEVAPHIKKVKKTRKVKKIAKEVAEIAKIDAGLVPPTRRLRRSGR